MGEIFRKVASINGIKKAQNILELALGTKTLSTLVTALKAGGHLVFALKGKGPLTVFAPSNAAFAKLPKATLKSLLEPKNKVQMVMMIRCKLY